MPIKEETYNLDFNFDEKPINTEFKSNDTRKLARKIKEHKEEAKSPDVIKPVISDDYELDFNFDEKPEKTIKNTNIDDWKSGGALYKGDILIAPKDQQGYLEAGVDRVISSGNAASRAFGNIALSATRLPADLESVDIQKDTKYFNDRLNKSNEIKKIYNNLENEFYTKTRGVGNKEEYIRDNFPYLTINTKYFSTASDDKQGNKTIFFRDGKKTYDYIKKSGGLDFDYIQNLNKGLLGDTGDDKKLSDKRVAYHDAYGDIVSKNFDDADPLNEQIDVYDKRTDDEGNELGIKSMKRREAQNFAGDVIQGTGDALAIMAPAIATGTIPVVGEVLAPTVFGLTGVGKYDENRRAGASVGAAGIDAGVNAASEILSDLILSGGLKPIKGLGGNILKGSGKALNKVEKTLEKTLNKVVELILPNSGKAGEKALKKVVEEAITKNGGTITKDVLKKAVTNSLGGAAGEALESLATQISQQMLIPDKNGNTKSFPEVDISLEELGLSATTGGLLGGGLGAIGRSPDVYTSLKKNKAKEAEKRIKKERSQNRIEAIKKRYNESNVNPKDIMKNQNDKLKIQKEEFEKEKKKISNISNVEIRNKELDKLYNLNEERNNSIINEAYNKNNLYLQNQSDKSVIEIEKKEDEIKNLKKSLETISNETLKSELQNDIEGLISEIQVLKKKIIPNPFREMSQVEVEGIDEKNTLDAINKRNSEAINDINEVEAELNEEKIANHITEISQVEAELNEEKIARIEEMKNKVLDKFKREVSDSYEDVQSNKTKIIEEAEAENIEEEIKLNANNRKNSEAINDINEVEVENIDEKNTLDAINRKNSEAIKDINEVELENINEKNTLDAINRKNSEAIKDINEVELENIENPIIPPKFDVIIGDQQQINAVENVIKEKEKKEAELNMIQVKKSKDELKNKINKLESELKDIDKTYDKLKRDLAIYTKKLKNARVQKSKDKWTNLIKETNEKLDNITDDYNNKVKTLDELETLDKIDTPEKFFNKNQQNEYEQIAIDEYNKAKDEYDPDINRNEYDFENDFEDLDDVEIEREYNPYELKLYNDWLKEQYEESNNSDYDKTLSNAKFSPDIYVDEPKGKSEAITSDFDDVEGLSDEEILNRNLFKNVNIEDLLEEEYKDIDNESYERILKNEELDDDSVDNSEILKMLKNWKEGTKNRFKISNEDFNKLTSKQKKNFKEVEKIFNKISKKFGLKEVRVSVGVNENPGSSIIFSNGTAIALDLNNFINDDVANNLNVLHHEIGHEIILNSLFNKKYENDVKLMKEDHANLIKKYENGNYTFGEYLDEVHSKIRGSIYNKIHRNMKYNDLKKLIPNDFKYLNDFEEHAADNIAKYINDKALKPTSKIGRIYKKIADFISNFYKNLFNEGTNVRYKKFMDEFIINNDRTIPGVLNRVSGIRKMKNAPKDIIKDIPKTRKKLIEKYGDNKKRPTYNDLTANTVYYGSNKIDKLQKADNYDRELIDNIKNKISKFADNIKPRKKSSSISNITNSVLNVNGLLDIAGPKYIKEIGERLDNSHNNKLVGFNQKMESFNRLIKKIDYDKLANNTIKLETDKGPLNISIDKAITLVNTDFAKRFDEDFSGGIYKIDLKEYKIEDKEIKRLKNVVDEKIDDENIGDVKKLIKQMKIKLNNLHINGTKETFPKIAYSNEIEQAVSNQSKNSMLLDISSGSNNTVLGMKDYYTKLIDLYSSIHAYNNDAIYIKNLLKNGKVSEDLISVLGEKGFKNLKTGVKNIIDSELKLNDNVKNFGDDVYNTAAKFFYPAVLAGNLGVVVGQVASLPLATIRAGKGIKGKSLSSAKAMYYLGKNVAIRTTAKIPGKLGKYSKDVLDKRNKFYRNILPEVYDRGINKSMNLEMKAMFEEKTGIFDKLQKGGIIGETLMNFISGMDAATIDSIVDTYIDQYITNNKNSTAKNKEINNKLNEAIEKGDLKLQNELHDKILELSPRNMILKLRRDITHNINRTQPTSNMQYVQNLRQENGWMKAFTMFKTQPLQNLTNIIVDAEKVKDKIKNYKSETDRISKIENESERKNALDKLKNDNKNTIKEAISTSIGITISGILFTSLKYAIKDNDDDLLIDNPFWKQTINNISGMIPGNDVINAIVDSYVNGNVDFNNKIFDNNPIAVVIKDILQGGKLLHGKKKSLTDLKPDEFNILDDSDRILMGDWGKIVTLPTKYLLKVNPKTLVRSAQEFYDFFETSSTDPYDIAKKAKTYGDKKTAFIKAGDSAGLKRLKNTKKWNSKTIKRQRH